VNPADQAEADDTDADAFVGAYDTIPGRRAERRGSGPALDKAATGQRMMGLVSGCVRWLSHNHWSADLRPGELRKACGSAVN